VNIGGGKLGIEVRFGLFFYIFGLGDRLLLCLEAPVVGQGLGDARLQGVNPFGILGSRPTGDEEKNREQQAKRITMFSSLEIIATALRSFGFE
jgi:hypothetical protein